ncbi:E3 ubiquitin-protein ligase ATL41 [Carex littledalei]|uniref:RING-type E3 ubiquitin transferase n=1 Tax=Carex littledalei TaxID=544730 RepID=A0A833QWZ0_9POAL|nr:E3 ubiquitin-protein ligase ATL41 [Carex littledalei]
MSINDSSSSFQPNDKSNYFSPSSSIVPIAFACGSGLAFIAIVIFFQFIFNRIDATSTETRVVRHQLDCIHGLSKIAISSLPTVKYNKNRANGAASDAEVCSVCLESFREGEMVRELTRCRHLFHTDCIDMWLYSHITCPLCRSVIGLAEGRRKVAAVESTAPLPLPPV